jgi:hypothetical protein
VLVALHTEVRTDASTGLLVRACAAAGEGGMCAQLC